MQRFPFSRQDISWIGLGRNPFDPDPAAQLPAQELPGGCKQLDIPRAAAALHQCTAYALVVDEKDDIINELGSKGVGEIGLASMAPAIANAIFHATGKRINKFPIHFNDLM